MLPLPTAIALDAARLGGGFDLGRYLVVVLGLFALSGLVLWGSRRLVRGALRQRAGKRSLAIVDVLPLGGRRQLAVVRCYDRTFALGLGDRDVALIAELDPVLVPAPEPGRARTLAPPDRETRRFEGLVERAQRELERRAEADRAGRAAEPAQKEVVA